MPRVLSCVAVALAACAGSTQEAQGFVNAITPNKIDVTYAEDLGVVACSRTQTRLQVGRGWTILEGGKQSGIVLKAPPECRGALVVRGGYREDAPGDLHRSFDIAANAQGRTLGEANWVSSVESKLKDRRGETDRSSFSVVVDGTRVAYELDRAERRMCSWFFIGEPTCPLAPTFFSKLDRPPTWLRPPLDSRAPTVVYPNDILPPMNELERLPPIRRMDFASEKIAVHIEDDRQGRSSVGCFSSPVARNTEFEGARGMAIFSQYVRWLIEAHNGIPSSDADAATIVSVHVNAIASDYIPGFNSRGRGIVEFTASFGGTTKTYCSTMRDGERDAPVGRYTVVTSAQEAIRKIVSASVREAIEMMLEDLLRRPEAMSR